jgi:hypothetical protein
VDVGFGFHDREARFFEQIAGRHRAPGIEMMVRVAGTDFVLDCLAGYDENDGTAPPGATLVRSNRSSCKGLGQCSSIWLEMMMSAQASSTWELEDTVAMPFDAASARATDRFRFRVSPGGGCWPAGSRRRSQSRGPSFPVAYRPQTWSDWPSRRTSRIRTDSLRHSATSRSARAVRIARDPREK